MAAAPPPPTDSAAARVRPAAGGPAARRRSVQTAQATGSSSSAVALALAVAGIAAAGAACTDAPTATLRPAATVEELMRSLIDPAADAIWDAVVVEATADGIVETRPETDGDWLRLRRHALTLAEAANLLQIDGRRIAAPSSRSDLPGIDLHPDAIQTLVADEWDAWTATAQGLHETSLVVRAAADAHDVDALLIAGTELDLACEACHAQFWYPGSGDPRPAAP